eukprot:gb/GECG01001096.1/.p1 GENE.gb/GECG01001096.1/~~gb/GECG01001096.1/.p1  ORF type:complete len:838 (+),score=83.79 gb/GECG01001096.1/:1-2514(+)
MSQCSWKHPSRRIQRLLTRYISRHCCSTRCFFDVTLSIGDDIEFLKAMIPDIPILGGVKNVISGLGSMLLNVDGAPIRVSSLVASHVFEDVNALTYRLLKFYVTNVLRGFYKIAGSASFLGNPVGLISNVGSDVVAVLYEPARGMLEGEGAGSTVKSVSSSAISLISNTTVGVFDSGGKLLQTLAKGIRAIDFEKYSDPVFQRKYAAIVGPVSSRGPRHLGEGFFAGTKAFSLSLFKGISGVVSTPYRGGKRDGALGFAKGFGMGIAGLVLKPTSGMLDMAVLSLRGIGSTVSSAANIISGNEGDESGSLRVRLPRFTGLYGIRGEKPLILSYSSREAEGNARLTLLQTSGEAQGEHYRFHAPVYGVLKYKHGDDEAGICGELSAFWEGRSQKSSKEQVNSSSSSASGATSTASSHQQTIVRQTTISTPAFGGIQMTIGRKAENEEAPTSVRRGGITGSSGTGISSFHQVRDISVFDRLRDRLTATPRLLHTKNEGPRLWTHTQKGYLMDRKKERSLECKFILLVTDKSVYLLHARTNRIYWRAVLHEKNKQGTEAFNSARARSTVVKHKHTLGVKDKGTKSGRAILVGPENLTSIAHEAIRDAIQEMPDREHLRTLEKELTRDQEAGVRQEKEQAATMERSLQLQETLKRERRRTLLSRIQKVETDDEPCVVPIEWARLDNFDHVREVMRQTNLVSRGTELIPERSVPDSESNKTVRAVRTKVEHVPVTVPVNREQDEDTQEEEAFETFSPSYTIYRTQEQFQRLLSLVPRRWYATLATSRSQELNECKMLEYGVSQLLSYMQRELLLQSRGNKGSLNPTDFLALRSGMEKFLGLV